MQNTVSFSIPNAVRSTSDILSILKNSTIENELPKNENLIINDGSAITSGEEFLGDKTNENETILERAVEYARSNKENLNRFSPTKKRNLSDDEIQNDVVADDVSEKVIFNVVWGKQTKKKHKTWEGDGTLEVINNFAVLKDIDGNILGRISNLKQSQLEDGSSIYVGSKEIQVIERAENFQNINASNKKPRDAEVTSSNAEHITKRPKLNRKGFISPLLDNNETDKFKTLPMPYPDEDHQEKCNINNEPITIVQLDSFLSRILRPHQKEGVTFLYRCISGINDVTYTGAILADEMGLGKTLQCIAVIWMCLKYGPYGGVPLVKKVLIVTPSSLVNNWVKEFKKWVSFERIFPFAVNKKNTISEYKKLVKCPVMIISYEMLVRHHVDIVDIKFDLIICDEGHRLKNSGVRAFVLLDQLSCKQRIILTGTPVQNNLQEFYTLVNFVNPGICGTNAEFKQTFEDPILISHQPNCTRTEQDQGKEQARLLNQRTNSFILRRTQDVINQYLPPKEDIILFCLPFDFQKEIYTLTVSYWERNELYKDFGCGNVNNLHLSIVTALKKICNHPSLLNINFQSSTTDNTDIIEDNFKQYLSDNLKQLKQNRANSGKMHVLRGLLGDLKPLSEKVVIVSYFTQTLDMIEKLCLKESYSFLRLDGSTPVAARSELVEKFNNSPSSNSFVFLLSAKAGGVGLNLIGASRLILFDLDWNPASDLQAMSRIWRDGQKKRVYIYRLLTTGTIEEKIYQRQISKTCLSNSVIDSKDLTDVRLSQEQLKDLFELKENTNSTTHDLLNCDCDGNGVPDTIFTNEIPSEEFEKSSIPKKNPTTDESTVLRITQLMEWEHYFSPYNEDMLTDLCLQSVSNSISMMFRNTSSV